MRRCLAAMVTLAVMVLASCGNGTPQRPAPTASLPAPASAPASASGPARYTKVMVIAEENHDYGQIIGSSQAPYLNQLAATFGTATHLDAGYPARCPSLAAYILLTSGTTDGICDDNSPAAHPLAGDNVFHQVAATGGEWRNYADSAPGTCSLDNGSGGRYLVRHVPSTYYLNERANCRRWTVPLGAAGAGALHDDIAAGTLPAYAFVSPDACHDMHGAPPCGSGLVAAGDAWLKTWMTQIFAGPDYRAGRLAVIITWDEGTGTDNHIPTLVVSPTTSHVRANQALTHCSTLRATEELLRLPLLGCAATAPAMTATFGL